MFCEMWLVVINTCLRSPSVITGNYRFEILMIFFLLLLFLLSVSSVDAGNIEIIDRFRLLLSSFVDFQGVLSVSEKPFLKI